MTTSARIGHSSLFQIGTLSPLTYATVGEILSVSGPSIARDAIDATHMTSTEAWREFITGLKDGGEVSMDLNLVPGSSGTTSLIYQLDIDTLTDCKIVIPQAAGNYEWTFQAILTGFEPEQPIDDKMMVTVTFKVTGKPTLAAAS